MDDHDPGLRLIKPRAQIGSTASGVPGGVLGLFVWRHWSGSSACSSRIAAVAAHDLGRGAMDRTPRNSAGMTQGGSQRRLGWTVSPSSTLAPGSQCGDGCESPRWTKGLSPARRPGRHRDDRPATAPLRPQLPKGRQAPRRSSPRTHPRGRGDEGRGRVRVRQSGPARRSVPRGTDARRLFEDCLVSGCVVEDHDPRRGSGQSRGGRDRALRPSLLVSAYPRRSSGSAKSGRCDPETR